MTELSRYTEGKKGSVPFDVGFPDTQDEVFLGQMAGNAEVCRRRVRDVRQRRRPSAVWTLPADFKGSVPCGRAEGLNAVE